MTLDIHRTYINQGLIRRHMGAVVSPGEKWGEFTRPFGREEGDVKALGNVAGTVVLDIAGFVDESHFVSTVERFAEEAEPPITGHQQDAFVGSAWNVMEANQAQVEEEPEAREAAASGFDRGGSVGL